MFTPEGFCFYFTYGKIKAEVMVYFSHVFDWLMGVGVKCRIYGIDGTCIVSMSSFLNDTFRMYIQPPIIICPSLLGGPTC